MYYLRSTSIHSGGSALTDHMEEHHKTEGPPNLVSFTYDTDYKLAYRGAFFYPFTFHMKVEIPLVEWSVQFARALVEFPTIDERLFIYKDKDDKADLNKGRTAEKFVEVLGMSEPTAIAAACAITCASRDLCRILRHDAPRESDNSVMIHEVVERFHYGPVMAALAVKTSGTSRFRAYLCYKDESQGQWCKSQDLGRDARTLAELRLMAKGGWSDKNTTNKRNSASATQNPNKDPAGPVSADSTKPSGRTLGIQDRPMSWQLAKGKVEAPCRPASVRRRRWETDDWVDITELEPEKQGPALRNRLEGEAAIHKRLLDRDKLKDKVNGVKYFKSYLRPLFVKGASNVFLYRFQQFMTLHRGSSDMLRWITRFQLSRARMQEAWDDTYVPITDVNNPEVRAYVSTLTQEEQNTITPEDALSAANARMKVQHSRTIPITENLVALMFVSLADLTQDQRQVLTSLMAHRNRPLADYRIQELREVYLYRSICSDIELKAEIRCEREETSSHRVFRDRNSGELRDLGV